MGQRIRHLEYYGYADQNEYIGFPNVDLSDIREVNKEQDKEISEISGATKDKADVEMVEQLSGKVETFADRQDEINKWLAKGIKKNKHRIELLEARDTEIVDKINEVADKFDPIYDELGTLSNSIDATNSRLDEHISSESDFEETTNERLEALENQHEDNITREEAYATFAKKEDVYTKDEVDDLIEGIDDKYATKDWVLGRGYITEEDANAKYASKARLNALEDRVGDIQTTLYNQYNALNADLSEFKTVTNSRIGSLNEKVNTLETKYDREIANLQEEDAELREDIQENTNAIYNINNVALPNKADKSDLTVLSSRVDTLSTNLANKVDKSDYERDKARFGAQLDALDNRKADKTALNALSGAIGDVADDLAQEIIDRQNGDIALGERIDGVNEEIREIEIGDRERDIKISGLERDLAKEINDRIEADNAIIGSPSDREEDATIYGAKKYADKVANNALTQAKAYTDVKDSAVRDYVDETRAELERDITAKADKAYVNAIRNEIDASVDSKIAAEKSRAETAEAALEGSVLQETMRATERERIISTALTHTSNIVKALTDWDGDDREDYTDEGNGIIDVMHREIHDIEETISAITQIGEGIKTSNKHEVGFGTYNQTHTGIADADKTMFSIGIGTSELDRKNGIEIRKNGDIYMWVEGEYIRINNFIGMLVHETY